MSNDPGLDEARATLARQLREHGHVVDLDHPGVYAFGRDFENIVAGISAAIHDLIQPEEKFHWWSMPPMEARQSFETTQYVEGFPQLTGAVNVFTGNDDDHKALLGEREAGRPWDSHLEPSKLTLVPATCHNIYGRYTGTLAAPTTIEAVGWCFRHEPSPDPMRFVAFRIQELVYIGDEAGAAQHRDVWLERLSAMCTELWLKVEIDIADDPFFGRAGRVLKAGQRSEALKFEILTNVYPQAPTAIASGNAHREHFSQAFSIVSADGAKVHTSCAGVGLERLTVALLQHHGMRVDAWPAEVRQRLNV